MKRLFTLCAIVIAVAVSSCSKFDDSAIWDKLNEQEQTLNDHEKRIAALEELCKQMNTNINALQTLVEALEKRDYVTNVSPVRKDGEVIGYTISFADSDTITIYHGENGKDGADGKDGYTPQIGVMKDTDGIYYWTLDGEWLLDGKGNKIQANGVNGIDGSDGSNGEDGTNGVDGNDGITPQLKIENGYWYVSYDNGSTWVELGKATGDDGKDGQNGADGSNGKDGADGKNGDSFFKSVDTSDTDYVIFTLADGTVIKLPTWYAFEQLRVLCNQMNTNIASLQSIVNALQNHDYITSCTPLMENGVQIGYTISFAKTGSIVIYHGHDGQNGTDGEDGKDGADGKDGSTPIIGVKQDTDNIYYWTINGEWLLDDNGNKIKAVGEDGSNGQDGTDGTNGSNGSNGQDGEDGTDGRDGVDGITPRLKIENDYWYVSYDEGATWIELGRATGEDGADGSDGVNGEDGDSIFSSVTQDEEYVYFNLADGTMITLPKHDKENIQFEDLQVKAICCKNWDTNNDGELSYAEAIVVKTINTAFKGKKNIIAFTELKYFTGITEIPASAFEGCTALWKVVIPTNATKIGDGAFSNCSGIVNISIHDCITSIGKESFSGCTSLVCVKIPNSVVSIGTKAFYNCNSMVSVHTTEGLENIKVPEYGAFGDCTGRVYINGNIQDGYAPVGLNYTWYGLFFSSKFTEAIIGENVTQIGAYAFYESTSLRNVYVKSTTPPSIGTRAFCYNKNAYSGDYPPISNLKIYVPTSSVDAYKSAWSTYSSIIEGYDFENNPI